MARSRRPPAGVLNDKVIPTHKTPAAKNKLREPAASNRSKDRKRVRRANSTRATSICRKVIKLYGPAIRRRLETSHFSGPADVDCVTVAPREGSPELLAAILWAFPVFRDALAETLAIAADLVLLAALSA